MQSSPLELQTGDIIHFFIREDGSSTLEPQTSNIGHIAGGIGGVVVAIVLVVILVIFIR